ncbi:MAG: hypothetical protein R6X19_10705 [Kiritimatiellia bacterium]
MKNAARILLNSVVALGAFLMAWGLTGCASYRIHSTLAPSGAPVPGATRFNLVDVQYAVPTNVTESALSPFNLYPITHASLTDDLMAVAVATYPAIFSTDPGSIPLRVTINCVNNQTEQDEATTCVSCLTLTILPLRTVDRDTYSVETRSGSEAIDKDLLRPVDFTRTDVSWLSITPTGWIPVPGGEGERVLGMDGAIVKVKDTTFKACVEAVVVSLRRIQPEAWSSVKPPTP